MILFIYKNKHEKMNYYKLFARVILMKLFVSVNKVNLNHFFNTLFFFLV